MSTGLLYAMSGALLFALGLGGMILRRHLLTRILGFNILGSGTFLVLVGLAQRDDLPDPVPHAMVLTGIVVSVAATALGLALARRLLDVTGHMRLPREPLHHDENEELATATGTATGTAAAAPAPPPRPPAPPSGGARTP